jgi:starch-binding outer membrane protein, SusD/RagB family
MKRLYNIGKLRLFTAFLLITILGSCEKFVDLEPENNTFNEAFWQDEKDAQQGLAGAYALLRKSLHGGYYNDSYFVYGDIAAKEFSEAGDEGFPRYVLNQARDLNFNGPGGYLEYTDWSSYYKVINQCNLVISKVAGIPDGKFVNDPVKTRNKIIGEAYFLRAFTYFYISRVWGDVPLVLELEDPVKAKNIPQTPAAQVLAQAIKDAEKAAELLEHGYTNANEKAVRANKGAAYALLAHIYMWQGDAAGGAQAALKVISEGGFSLVPTGDYARIFTGKTNEGIFEITKDFGQNEAPINAGFPYMCLKDPYIAGKNLASVVNKPLLTELYKDAGDIRINTFFANYATANPLCIKFSNVIYKEAATSTQPAVSNPLIIFRLADIILLRAEALAKLGDYSGARTELKKITDRANVAPFSGTDDKLYEYIIDERTRELFMEGHRYYDIVRSGFLDKKLGMTGDRVSRKGYYWPVANGVLNANRLLVQVPYWQNK